MEHKTFAFELKEATDQGIVNGYAAAIGNVDDGNDIIMPGAMDRSITKSKGVMPIFYSHDWSRIPLGYGTDGKTDTKGLDVTGEMTIDIPDVRDAHTSLKHAKKVGFKMGISIGYQTKDYDMDGSIRRLKEIDVFEWSLTPFPMNRRARVGSVKSSVLEAVEAIDADILTERDFEGLLRDVVGLSSREAKSLIALSRRLRDPLNGGQRDVAHVTELPDALKDIKGGLVIEAGLAEIRKIIRG